MVKNKPFIDKVIQGRMLKKDPVQQFTVRNKASPLNVWEKLQPYKEKRLNILYFTNIDGVKLKFKHTTLTINGRHKSI